MPIYWSPAMYVIERKAGEFLVDDPNRTGSTFTNRVEHARQFCSREAAQRECCQNEHPRQIDNTRPRKP